MNYLLVEELSECIAHCRKLISVLEQEKDEIAGIFSGEILDEYCKNIDIVLEKAREMEKEISVLHDEQCLFV